MVVGLGPEDIVFLTWTSGGETGGHVGAMAAPNSAWVLPAWTSRDLGSLWVTPTHVPRTWEISTNFSQIASILVNCD